MPSSTHPHTRIRTRSRVLELDIRRRLRWHLRELGFQRDGRSSIAPERLDKEHLRSLHRKARTQVLRRERAFVKEAFPRLKEHFASGSDVTPDAISVRLQLVASDTEESELFRLASLTWGVPVTAGYGRRMRFLVWDKSNEKLVGLIGLSDPVFNLSTRDNAIGWSGKDRLRRLVDVMNANVLGAVPPYNMLLGGKLVASLVRTKEVRDAFTKRYSKTRGIISGERKKASLLLVTVTSSLGKSSVYDRITLNGVPYLQSIGYTSGWGHFHVPDNLFHDIQKYLRIRHHEYANGNRFGEGANWRLRTTRAALVMMGMDPNLLRHNIKREVFLCRLAKNTDAVLKGDEEIPDYRGLMSVRRVSEAAVERWVVKRALSRPDYLQWSNDAISRLLDPRTTGIESLVSLPPHQSGLPLPHSPLDLLSREQAEIEMVAVPREHVGAATSRRPGASTPSLDHTYRPGADT